MRPAVKFKQPYLPNSQIAVTKFAVSELNISETIFYNVFSLVFIIGLLSFYFWRFQPTKTIV